jgi:hypothetical protein
MVDTQLEQTAKSSEERLVALEQKVGVLSILLGSEGGSSNPEPGLESPVVDKVGPAKAQELPMLEELVIEPPALKAGADRSPLPPMQPLQLTVDTPTASAGSGTLEARVTSLEGAVLGLRADTAAGGTAVNAEPEDASGVEELEARVQALEGVVQRRERAEFRPVLIAKESDPGLHLSVTAQGAQVSLNGYTSAAPLVIASFSGSYNGLLILQAQFMNYRSTGSAALVGFRLEKSLDNSTWTSIGGSGAVWLYTPDDVGINHVGNLVQFMRPYVAIGALTYFRLVAYPTTGDTGAYVNGTLIHAIGAKADGMPSPYFLI